MQAPQTLPAVLRTGNMRNTSAQRASKPQGKEWRSRKQVSDIRSADATLVINLAPSDLSHHD